MKLINTYTIAFAFVSSTAYTQYTHPTVGIQSEYVGGCLVATCGPANYYDNGGAGGNYSNSINNIYRVFCPNTAGRCMRVTFTAFDVQPYNWLFGWRDYLTVGNGPTQNSPVFTSAPADPGNGRIAGTPAVPFSFTSSDPSGCLTFRFTSNGSTNAAGWASTLTCVPCAIGPNGTDNNDCIRMTPLCSSAAISGNASGPGIVAEGCNGSTCPAGGENHTNWYTFQAQTTGTLNINIIPTDPLDDYDFAIYGPNVTCAALGNPIRCTDSGLTGPTGMNGTAGDNIENVLGNSFLQTMNVTAGQTYILVVDEWSPNAGSGYALNFSGTASLDCIILPIELSEFEANYVPEQDVVDLLWKTESERFNDYFSVERSEDGETFVEINQVKSVGFSTEETTYYTIDEEPYLGTNYYRLKQVDQNGNSSYSEVISVNILDEFYDILSVFPNPSDGNFEVIFNAYGKDLAELKIYSMSGKLIEHATLECTPGGNRFALDLGAQSDGIYLLTIMTNNKTYTTKIEKH